MMLASRGQITFLLLITTVSACAQSAPLAPGVKGAPFSADLISESVQTLSDGTHITSGGAQGRAYRDSLGRTRQETYNRGTKDEPKILIGAQIIDPVQHLYIFLDPQAKTAEVRNSDGANWGLNTSDPPPTRTKLPGEEEEALGAAVHGRFTVTGRRYTSVVEAGRVGNDKPFANVREEWFSPALKMVVMHTNENPRDGRSVWKLTNIQPVEPDPVLFLIPHDYTVTRQ